MEETFDDYYIKRTLDDCGIDWFLNKGELYAYVMEEIPIFTMNFIDELLVVTHHFEDLSSEVKNDLIDLFKYLFRVDALSVVSGIDLDY